MLHPRAVVLVGEYIQTCKLEDGVVQEADRLEAGVEEADHEVEVIGIVVVEADLLLARFL